MVATSVTVRGEQEVLGIEVGDTEDPAFSGAPSRACGLGNWGVQL